MDLTQALKATTAHSYDRQHALGTAQPIFGALEEFAAALEVLIPAGYRVRISRGVGNLPVGLWVAVLNEEVTVTPTDGLYIVYLFDETRQSVSLSLNQGVTKAAERARVLPISANAMLREEASELRGLLPAKMTTGLSTTISLGSGSMLKAYEAGNIYARTWALAALPSESDFKAALDLFIDLYDAAVEAKENALKQAPGKFSTPARSDRKHPEPVFAPKSSDDYQTAAKLYVEPQRRQRKHELLVKDFGEFAKIQGFVPATNHHPIDLALFTDSGEELIVEVKILNDKHPAGGVRESIGQLFEYRKFLRPTAPHTPLVVVYDWYPNQAFVDLLDDLGIATCWRTESGFSGTKKAAGLGLV